MDLQISKQGLVMVEDPKGGELILHIFAPCGDQEFVEETTNLVEVRQPTWQMGLQSPGFQWVPTRFSFRHDPQIAGNLQ